MMFLNITDIFKHNKQKKYLMYVILGFCLPGVSRTRKVPNKYLLRADAIFLVQNPVLEGIGGVR